jgi:[acyl-carrier-protein] S-malonyltransferase
VSVSKPDDLDVLVEALAGEGPLHSYAAAHQGEHLYTSERLVLTQVAGLFQPRPDLEARLEEARAAGQPDVDDQTGITVGEVVGSVGSDEVRSPFSGSLQGFLALGGQRVLTGQPVAWLRAAPTP